jgi:hypothetical protein
MSKSYSEAVYGDVRRHWFSSYKSGAGGRAAMAVQEAEQLAYVDRYYPKGPIQILKFGVQVASTLGKAEQMMSLYRNASRLATAVCSTTGSEFVVDSVAVNKVCAAGSYLNIIASTNTCSTGSVACFIDYIPYFDNTTKWSKVGIDGRTNRVAA